MRTLQGPIVCFIVFVAFGAFAACIVSPKGMQTGKRTMIKTREMTILEVLALKRETNAKMRRRQLVCARIAGFFRAAIFILALTWCYALRGELARIIMNLLERC